MKRFIIFTILVAAFGISNLAQAQFKNAKNSWGLSAGGVHGTNATADEWGMQYRGYFSHEIIPEQLIGQLALGYESLVASGVYSSYVGTLDVRALYTPFSLEDLNPYVYGGFGLAKADQNGSGIIPIVPLGIGAQTMIINGVSLDVSGGYTLAFSDKLDGIARSNNNLNGLTNGKQDGYYGFSIGLTFSLGVNAVEKKTDMSSNTKQLDAADARRVKELAAAEAVRVKQKADADAAAKMAKENSDSNAKLAKANSDSDAKLAKASADADAKLAKAAADADARLLAGQKGRDTVIVLQKGKSVVLRGVNFEFNKSTLVGNSETILWRAYSALEANPTVSIVITGHTDNIGSQETNQILSLERAQTVRNWLVNKGIVSSRMRTFGRGQNEPVASNDTDDGRARNRRIEFFVEK
jgi:outer membrane protein OmpA-like peptidoglycan-associated protein